MKEIKYPLEIFAWNKFDSEGNVRLEIRDADENTVFFVSMKGREMYEAKRFEEELVPLIVKVINRNANTFDPMEARSKMPDPVTVPIVDQSLASENGKKHEWIPAGFYLNPKVLEEIGKTDKAKVDKIEKRHRKIVAKMNEKYAEEIKTNA